MGICLIRRTAKPCVVNRAAMPEESRELALCGLRRIALFSFHFDIVACDYSFDFLRRHSQAFGCGGRKEWMDSAPLNRQQGHSVLCSSLFKFFCCFFLIIINK